MVHHKPRKRMAEVRKVRNAEYRKERREEAIDSLYAYYRSYERPIAEILRERGIGRGDKTEDES